MAARAGARHNALPAGVAHHARESYTPKATCRRPNSDVLARERERVGPGLSVPVAPIMEPSLGPASAGLFFLEPIPALGIVPLRKTPKSFRNVRTPRKARTLGPRFGGAFSCQSFQRTRHRVAPAPHSALFLRG
jgi:hypothetical protein